MVAPLIRKLTSWFNRSTCKFLLAIAMTQNVSFLLGNIFSLVMGKSVKKRPKSLSNAERQRRWRAKQMATAEGRQKYLQEEKARYRRRKEQGKLKSIQEMSNNQQRSTRRRWRKATKAYRERRRAVERLLTPVINPERGEDANPVPSPQ